MKIATTTGDFGRYQLNDIEIINELNKAGFKYVDLSMYEFTPDSPYMKDSWREEVKKLKAEARRLGMSFVQAHSQGGNPLSENESQVDFLIKATLRSIEICAELDIKNTVVHPGQMLGISKEEWFVKNKAFYEKLLPTAEKLGINILIENSCAVNSGACYWANTGKDMREFLEFVNHPNLHACWDTGHGNCDGAQYDNIKALGEELYAIHYNDNRGSCDEHLLPFLGTLNHDEVINALIDINYKGCFTLECCSTLRPDKYWLGNRKSFDGENRLSNPPLFMQQKLEELLYNTAKHILTSYSLFEE